MVGVAQLVELLIVVQAVAGSSPVAHPICFREPLAKISHLLSGIDLQCLLKKWFAGG